MIASCTRLYYVVNFSPIYYQYYWTTDKSVMWSTLEHCFGVICISLPSMRPLFRKLNSRIRGSKNTITGASGGPGNSTEEPSAVPQGPRIASADYWARLQFASFSFPTTSRRPSTAIIQEFPEPSPGGRPGAKGLGGYRNTTVT
jgi:hypothetical protein